MIKKEKYVEEGLDLKRLSLVMLRKIWIIFVVTVVMAVIGLILYEFSVRINYPEPIYQGEAEYHICFDETDEYADVKNYYNAYTWDSILKMDPIVETAMTVLPDTITKEMIQESVAGEMIGDIRFLTVKFTGTDKETIEQIQTAYKMAVENFATTVGGITTIEMWRSEEIVEVKMDIYWKNALYLGAILGFCISFFGLLVLCIVDDTILVPGDLKKLFGVRVLGIRTKQKNTFLEKELACNLDYLSGNGNKILKEVTINREDIDFQSLREADGTILLLPFGKTNGKQVERTLEQLLIQECNVIGCMIVDADDVFMKQYYMTRAGKNS
ncbi:MAG: hypothetical protein R3Y24_10915 [Eubacteriales bacterium]